MDTLVCLTINKFCWHCDRGQGQIVLLLLLSCSRTVFGCSTCMIGYLSYMNLQRYFKRDRWLQRDSLRLSSREPIMPILMVVPSAKTLHSQPKWKIWQLAGVIVHSWWVSLPPCTCPSRCKHSARATVWLATLGVDCELDLRGSLGSCLLSRSVSADVIQGVTHVCCACLPLQSGILKLAVTLISSL